MDINKLIERVKNILLTPKTEWPVIAQEQTDVAKLYTGYIMILAAIPAVINFLVYTMAGSFMAGLVALVLGYALSLGLTFLMAIIIDALAPTFGAEKNQIQALKTAAYANTAGWIGGIFAIIPLLGFLLVWAAAIYGWVLLYFGLPHTMKAPPEKVGGYFAVVLIIGFVLSFIAAMIIGGIAAAMLIGAAVVAS